MSPNERLSAPSLPWRAASTFTMSAVGILSKSFLNLACTTKVHGLDGFLKILDQRRDVANRDRGLITGIVFTSSVYELNLTITVSNHLSVFVLPIHFGE
jgi:hypothetical protein